MMPRCSARWVGAGFAAALALCAGVACTSAPAGRESGALAPVPHEMLNATLWQQGAAEHRAILLQSYGAARRALDTALADPDWSAALEQRGNVRTLPPAVMLDLDETVFDNTPYEARLVLRHGRFTPESFAAWCEEARAPAVPGVEDFLNHALRRGVTIFYFSARKESLRECTIRNLRHLGLPIAPERVLLNDGTSKAERRRDVARHYRILLLVGDNLEDFVAGSRASPQARRAVAQRYHAYWGTRWIMLPNPMYGHWEASHYDFDYRLPRGEQLRRKRQALQDRR